MIYLPLFNLLFLFLLFRVHFRVFIVTLCIELVLNIGGIYYIYSHFSRQDNHFLYSLFLLGVGFIIVLAAFFIAVLMNHQRLYQDLHE